MSRSSGKHRSSGHQDGHEHQQVPLHEQDPQDSHDLPTLNIIHAQYYDQAIPRSPQWPDASEYVPQDGNQIEPPVSTASTWAGAPPEHYLGEPDYTLDKGKGVDLGSDDDLEDDGLVQYPYSGQPLHLDNDEDDIAFENNTQVAINMSRIQTYQTPDAGQPSTSTPSDFYNNFEGTTPVTYQQQNTHLPIHGGSRRPTQPQHLSPALAARPKKHKKNANAHATTDYAVAHSSNFRFGAVFKINWYEPRGVVRRGSTIDTLPTDGGDDPCFSGIRRFIVVKEARGHSVCVGLYTHGHQGCLKNGVHPEHHSQAYDERYEVPDLLPGEPALGVQPIPITINPELAWETINPISRINLVKLHTINHNVPVSFIGSVAPNYHQYLRNCINTLFRMQDVPSGRQHGGRGKGKGKGKDRKH